MTYQFRGNIDCVRCGVAGAVGRKLCRKCYNQIRAAGQLSKYPLIGPHDVFEKRIKKTPDCWLWTGTKNDYGYGIFLMPGEKSIRAHRYSYEFFTKQKIPNGMIIMHLCDNPPCVNPDHLRVATKRENNADTANKHRHHYGLDHWNGRLSNDDIANIRASTEPKTMLAKKYGVNYSHIWRIQNKQTR
jgi:hypothetical protein